jgi:acetoin utilization deacetylase AcuC-like enzyme
MSPKKKKGKNPVEKRAMSNPFPLYYCEEFLHHDTGAHPENANRLVAILNILEKDFLLGKVELREPLTAEKEDICTNHDEIYFDRIKNSVNELESGEIRHLDPDTVISNGSFIAALKSAGCGLSMLENYYGKNGSERENRGLGIGRPPGHHSLRDYAMGFCLFNNIAIAAHLAKMKYGLKRIAILDWDVHHGNGTENSFYHDNEVLYLSTHQYPCFPGTGHVNDIGSGKGECYNVNLPVPPGSGDTEMKYCFVKVLMPILEQFNPEILLVSAGYDAHKRDPLAWLNWTTSSYTWMSALLDKFCLERNIPMFAFLEGGYDFQALAESIRETIRGFSGEAELESPDLTHTSQPVRAIVDMAVKALGSRWKF